MKLRKAYQEILKNHFHSHLWETMIKNGEMSNTKLAHCLLMSERSFHDLAQGKFCCGSFTLIMYLLYLCEDYSEFLDGLRKELEDAGILLMIGEGREPKK